MIQYIYFVKCPNCEDEHFDFFDEAKEFALGCLSQKPTITQIEVDRNDFGECVDSCDLGTVWSWEDMMGEADAEPAKSIFTKDDLTDYTPDEDPEFQDDGAIEGFLTEAEQKLATNSKGDYLVRASSGLGYTVFNRSNVAIGGFEEDDDNTAITRFRRGNIKEHVNQENPAIESDQKLYGIDNAVVDCKVAKVISHSEDEKPLNEESAEESCRKPVPEGMSLKDLVEAMEENEDTVECVGCEELFPKDECVHKDGIGWLCGDCEDSVVKCTWCEELFDRSECRMEVDLGWLCDRCEAAIKSRGETLTFREGNYWDFLDEEADNLLTESEETPEVNKQTAAEALADKINQKASAEEKAAMLKKIAEQIPPDKVAAVAKDIKSKIKDYNLTEEDKNILKTKTKIDPKLIDKADSLLTLINSFLDNVQVSLPVLGAMIDIIHLVVPDEALAVVCPPLGAILAILSYIPEGIVVSILLDFGITALRGISTLAKNAVISLVDLKDAVKESFPDEPEEISSHLKFCPECGKDTFDTETGICITCGFN